MATLQDWHWEMWNAIAENDYTDKRQWKGWQIPEVQELKKGNYYISILRCFACAIRDSLSYKDADNCRDVCPIKDWQTSEYYDELDELEDTDDAPCEAGLFGIWANTANREERKQLAIAIADAWEDENA